MFDSFIHSFILFTKNKHTQRQDNNKQPTDCVAQLPGRKVAGEMVYRGELSG